MYLVYGLQKSGISIIKLLEKKNMQYRIWDDNTNVRNTLRKTYNFKLFHNPEKKGFNSFEKVFVSPGISLRQKKFKIKNRSKIFNRDLNLYISNLTNQKIIAITGTNGKSTTTKLIGDILEKNNIKSFVGGNIGKPLCSVFLSKNNFKFHVIELSSFQLETTKNFKTKISIITNLANDHLDRYKNLQDYINQKKNIISKEGINLISIDDKHSKSIFLSKKIKNKISFSINDRSADFYMGKNFIIDNYFKFNKKINIKKFSNSLEGKFNNQNILISYICNKLLKLPNKNFLNVIKNFRGLQFRSQIIYDNKKIKIVNNSKSTNIDSTLSSIQNYQNIYLILGGIAKEKNFEILSQFKERIICVYVFGESASFIQNKIKKKLVVKKFKNLKSIVNQIFKDIDRNISSNILFAPACSSYDQYENYIERGKDFSQLIKNKVFSL